MRPEIVEMQTALEAHGKQLHILDYGPCEGDELARLVELGYQVDAVNFWNKTPINGVSYQEQDGEAAASYDAIICAHLLSWGHIGYGKALAKSLLHWTKPGGLILICAPVGYGAQAFSRFYGVLRIYQPQDILDLFRGQSELALERYLIHGRVTDYIPDLAGIIQKEIRQVGVYAFRKVNVKKKVTGHLPTSMEEDQALPPGWKETLVIHEADAPVQAGIVGVTLGHT